MGAISSGIAASAASARASTWRDTLAAYIALTKPRIISLLLITTIPAMILAEKGVPPLWLVAATVIGGTLAAGGANAINCYIDRDIDAIMARTRSRPLPSGRLEPQHALVFAVALEVAAFALLAITSNLLAATLAVSAAAFYVFVYTIWLKRTSRQNIVIGGAAGAVPPLVGWAAVTGDVSLAAVILFAIVFVWTPPHFWSLSIRYRDDYERANVPMLPVVATLSETKAQIFWYSAALLPVSVALWLTGDVSWVYLVSAIGLGLGFVWQAWRLQRDDRPGAAMGVFKYSVYYLAALFVAVAADQLVLG